MELGSTGEGVAYVKSGVLSPLTGETNPSQALRRRGWLIYAYTLCRFWYTLTWFLAIVGNRQYVICGLNSSVCRRVESRGKVTAALSGRTWWIATDGVMVLKVRIHAKRYFVITAFLQRWDCFSGSLAHKMKHRIYFWSSGVNKSIWAALMGDV